MLSQEPCLGGVVDLQALGQRERGGGVEGFVEGGDGVGVEVVHDQDDLLGLGVVDGQESFDLPGPINLGPVGLGVDPPPPTEGFDPAEDRAGAVADVLAVLLEIPSRCGGDRVAGVRQELVGLLVHAHHWPGRVVGPGIDRENVLHCRGEGRVRLRRDHPAFP
jgi:hypothetical protein